MARITVEDCLDNIDNIFEMVLVASKRARRIAHGAEPFVDTQNDKPTVIALREIADGSVTPAILDEVEELRATLPVDVVTWDERLTTVEAERSLRVMGVSKGKRRRIVDQVAATVILQSWLDAGPPRG